MHLASTVSELIFKSLTDKQLTDDKTVFRLLPLLIECGVDYFGIMETILPNFKNPTPEEMKFYIELAPQTRQLKKLTPNSIHGMIS